MREIGVEISLCSPALLASAPPASNQLDTLRFIPGNTLRGVMARRYLDLGHSPESEEFQRLFVSGEVRYGFAFVKGSEVLPLSARSCKYDAGFSVEGGHGVVDLLLPGAGKESCPAPGCGRPLDHLHGFWLPQEKREVAVDTRLVTRTAIDPQRGTARSGQLYSQRVLAEGQAFFASLEAPEDLAPRILEILEKGFEAMLGTGGSRGQGWAEVRSAGEKQPGLGSARARYERFRAGMERPVLAVTLLTDGLFRDDYLRESSAPSLADLAPLGIDPEDWQTQPARAFTSFRQVFGFDGIPLRLPRPPRIAVAAGSAFLFETVEGRDPVIPEGSGVGWIGEVNGEGYGRAVLWHPFHVDAEGAGP